MSDKKTTLAAIVVSGDPATFSTWLRSTFLELARHANVRIVLVPFGAYNKAVRHLAPQSIEICEPSSKDTTLEANRNTALEYLRAKRADKADLVAFLDDDTFVNPAWVDAMTDVSDTNRNIDAFASVVFTEGWSEMQGQGHVFIEGAPRDRGYRGKCLKQPILCPCGNSAVIRWTALERIWRVDRQAWDPLFKQAQTCFDFGLKLYLTNTRTMVVPGAVTQHRGYLTWDAAKKKENGCAKAERQLTSRYLLYKKFLPKDLEQKVLAHLEQKLGKWQKNGYPGFEECVIGEKVKAINKKAKNCADDLAREIKCETWKSSMKDLEKTEALKILGLT